METMFVVVSHCDYMDAFDDDNFSGLQVRIVTPNLTKAYNMLDFWRIELMNYMERNGGRMNYGYSYHWGDSKWEMSWTINGRVRHTKIELVKKKITR